MMKRTIGLAGLTLAACSGEVGQPSAPSGPVSAPGEVREVPRGEGEVLPTPEAALRQRRRMDLDQLEASIRAVTGGLGWTERRGGREVSLFEELGPTLGVPDFLEVTTEDLSPSAMFQKFLDDAARSVCGRLLEAERTRAESARTFFVHIAPDRSPRGARAATRENLAHLLLRFHGHRYAPGAPPVDAWMSLLTEVETATGDAALAWKTVCVGLITHPDFYLY
jgi:hypothetical protein